MFSLFRWDGRVFHEAIIHHRGTLYMLCYLNNIPQCVVLEQVSLQCKHTLNTVVIYVHAHLVWVSWYRQVFYKHSTLVSL